MSRLPPLSALRAFEIAGRSLSFSRAAEALGVTPGAISRQIRNLETFLGVPLFERQARTVTLTGAGKIYLDSLQSAFGRLDLAARRLIDSRAEDQIHIHVAVTFSMKWLVKRLVSYHSAYPNCKVQLSTGFPDRSDLMFYPTDVLIDVREEPETEPDIVSHRLVDIDLVPVCSPSFMAAVARSDGSLDLTQVPLLSSAARPGHWDDWWRGGPMAHQELQGSPLQFDSSSLAYKAAVEGLGVAIAVRALVTDDIQEGRLVYAHDAVVKTDSAYYLLYSRAAEGMRQVQEFRDWILQQAVP